MSKLHLHVRAQIVTDDPAPIVSAVEALREAVGAAGGDPSTVSLTIESDEPSTSVTETPPAESPSVE